MYTNYTLYHNYVIISYYSPFSIVLFLFYFLASIQKSLVGVYSTVGNGKYVVPISNLNQSRCV